MFSMRGVISVDFRFGNCFKLTNALSASLNPTLSTMTITDLHIVNFVNGPGFIVNASCLSSSEIYNNSLLHRYIGTL